MKYRFLIALAAVIITAGSLLAQGTVHDVAIDAKGSGHAFPHFWEETFGSGRAILALRDNYRRDLKEVHDNVGMRYVRFHAILHDEVEVYDEDEGGKPVYNFTYVDQIYDGLLDRGVRPFVEISFMPKKLAFNPDALHPFWYKQNVSPPKNMDTWDDMMTHFAKHLVDRYGIDEVSQWYFEVWNEPNIDFWNGIPRDRSYFDLYAHTARDLKGVSPRLRVGGPATAAAAWVSEFLAYTAQNHVPVDFVSTHGYADDTTLDLFGKDLDIPMDERVCRAVEKVHNEIKQSSTPDVPLFWTEWNVQGMKESRDTIFVGPGLANTIRQCDGLVDMMSWWTFSDVFEEGGPISRPFVGMFGLRAKGGINKPSYYAYGLLHELGDRRIASDAKDAIVTKAADGGVAVALWNIVDPDAQGETRKVSLMFAHVTPNARVTIERVDRDHGDVLSHYAAMGSPEDPTAKQVEELNRESTLAAPERTALSGGRLELTLTPNALVLVKVEK
ncbi:MAG TPA: glycosyl hydrolase family 39 [Terracidiphilus sp.]